MLKYYPICSVDRITEGIINERNKTCSHTRRWGFGILFCRRFFDTPEFSTVLIAKESRLERLQRDGLEINGKHYPFAVIDPEQSQEPMDLIIVALKQYHLEEALRGLDKLVGDDTIFVSFMNGLESEDCIAEIFGMDKVLHGISVGIDAPAPGESNDLHQPRKALLR